MDRVNFVTIEEGEDLILSFSFDEGTEFGVGGFVIQRTPKLEFAIMPHERGPSIDWTEDDEIILVKEVNLDRKSITIKTQYDSYAFDLSRISDDEYESVIRVLKKMNFDNNFEFHQKS